MATIRIKGVFSHKRREPQPGELWLHETATATTVLLVLLVDKSTERTVQYFNLADKKMSCMNMPQFLASFKFGSDDFEVVPS